MRVERSGVTNTRVENGITCTNSSTDDLELIAVVIMTDITSQVVIP